MEKIKNNVANQKIKASKIVKNTLGALIITFSLQTPVKADFATQLITNPAYSFFPGNIFHEIIWDDETKIKDPNLKKVIKESKKNLEKYNIDDINDANKFILTTIGDFNEGKIQDIEFLEKLISFQKKYNINNNDFVNIMEFYLKRNYLSKDRLVKLRKTIGVRLNRILSFYNDKADDKIKEVIKLYQENKLDEKNIKIVFKEYLKEKKEKDRIFVIVSIIIMFILFGMIGYTIKDI